MKITFVQDHQSVLSGNSHYTRGTQADLPRGQALIDLGVARAGWEPIPVVEEPEDEQRTDEDFSQYTVAELRDICDEWGLPHAGLRKAELIELIEGVTNASTSN
jgi:hypothetical protein